MSDTFASIIFVFVVYCAWAIAVYKPQPVQSIDYFPEVEDTEEEIPTPEVEAIPDWEKEFMEAEPVVVVFEPRPVAAFNASKTISNLIKEEAVKAEIVRPDYATMSIRQLKAEAQKLTGTDRAISGYSRLTRQQLITALSK